MQDEKGRWYIPDTTKEGDVAKLREKKLWKEFEGYMNSKGKLKLFRSEADPCRILPPLEGQELSGDC